MNATRRLRRAGRALCCRRPEEELLIVLSTFVVCFVLFAR